MSVHYLVKLEMLIAQVLPCDFDHGVKIFLHRALTYPTSTVASNLLELNRLD